MRLVRNGADIVVGPNDIGGIASSTVRNEETLPSTVAAAEAAMAAAVATVVPLGDGSAEAVFGVSARHVGACG